MAQDQIANSEVARRIIRAALNGERNVITLSDIGAGGQE